MPVGYWCPVLHAHLPYVRHPEYPAFLEEDWFFEALTETYVPIVRVLDGLLNDGVEYRLTMTLSPPLVSMMTDELLVDRYHRHLDSARRARRAARSSAREARAAPPRARAVLPARASGRPPRLPGGLRLEPRRRVPQAPRRRQARDHHLRRDARLPPADGPGAAGGARAGAGGGAALPQALRPRRGGHLAARVRLPARPRGVPARGGHPLLLPRVARPHRRPPAPELRRPRADRLAGRHRLLRRATWSPRARCGAPSRATRATSTTASSTRTSAGSCRSTTSRTSCPTASARTSASSTTASRGAAPTSAHKQPYVRAWALEKAASHAGNFLYNRTKQVEHLAGRLRPPADRREPLRRGAVRPLVVRGPAVPRLPVPQDALRPGRREADDAVRVPRALPGARGLPAADVHLGRRRLRRGVAQRVERLDLPAPRHGGRAHGRAGAALREPERARVARAQPGRARAAAGAVLGLGLHHEDEHHGRVREEADPRPHRALRLPLPRAHAPDDARGADPRASSRRATTSSRRSTTGSIGRLRAAWASEPCSARVYTSGVPPVVRRPMPPPSPRRRRELVPRQRRRDRSRGRPLPRRAAVAPLPGRLVALVRPHAGLRYSGPGRRVRLLAAARPARADRRARRPVAPGRVRRRAPSTPAAPGRRRSAARRSTRTLAAALLAAATVDRVRRRRPCTARSTRSRCSCRSCSAWSRRCGSCRC